MEPKPTHLPLFLLLLLSSVSESAIVKPSSSSSNPSISFIVSSCRVTRYPKLCVKCLSAYAPKIHRNEHRLAQAALATTLARAKSTTVFVSKLACARHIKRREYLAVKDCVENLGDGVDRLAESAREMNRLGPGGDRTEFMWRMSNVETWVSAALTDETTCLDGFGGRAMDGVVKVAIRRRVVHVARVTSNALALVNRFADRHRSSVIVDNNP
ncbi:PREDICTED: 21 kDa protein [Tarenaya hassleriana]|uniref:21 kDa protein n=1 Tax=Tarenaya hassleriana TaxID=28532 RepID=UPI00053C16C8|nr:PREDICTED: 21 kDa protein [Tarenaya hassleriana]